MEGLRIGSHHRRRTRHKAFENEKSTAPTAIMMTQITDSIKDEVLDKEVYSYTMVCASLFERYLRVNFEAVP